MAKESQKHQELLNQEKKTRMALEVELVGVKMGRDKEMKRLNLEISRLEELLDKNQVTYTRTRRTSVSQINNKAP